MANPFTYMLLEDGAACVTRYEGRALTVDMPETIDGHAITAIGEGAFAQCKSMMFLLLPDGVRSIGAGAFRECTALASVYLPEGLETIGEGAFKDCGALNAIALPDSLTHIGAEAFRGCRSLPEIGIPAGVAQIAERAFSGCAALAAVSLPDGLTHIGDSAFSKCVSLSEIALPGSLREIGRDAFFSCAALGEITLPEGLARVGDRAFYECAHLACARMPDSLHTIGSGVFYSCAGLMLVAAPGSPAEAYARQNKLSLAHGCADSLYYNILADGSAEIIRYAGGAMELDVPARLDGHAVASIGSCAFRFCAALERVRLPEGLRSIGAGAFHGCGALTAVSLPQSLEAIGSDAFKACAALGEIALPGGLARIGGYAFYGCAALKAIALPDGLREIGSFTFCDCTALEEISLPAGLETIGMSAFNGCAALHALSLPQGLETIGAKAFKNCRSLPAVHLPDGLRAVGTDAFSGCAALILHGVPGSPAQAYAQRESVPFIADCAPESDDPLCGLITTRTEFLSPDMALAPMPRALHAACARNGSVAVQLLLGCGGESASLRVVGPAFDAELCELIDVPAECGAAPRRVYDCMRPTDGAALPSRDGRAAACVCFSPKAAFSAGTHPLYLEIRCGERTHVCRIDCTVYPVAADDNLFRTTNWFSIAAMEQTHSVACGTPEFEAVLRAYARSMRRAHQKVFRLPLHDGLGVCRAGSPRRFDFEAIKPVIELFFDEGFDTLETGGILCRSTLPDGSPDMDAADLKCSADPSVSADSDEGYALLCAEMQAFSAFLARCGWQDRVLFHIIDEPDMYVQSAAALQACRVQYLLAANIVRRYLPGARIIESVGTTLLRGGVDVMVPAFDRYEQSKPAFDAAAAVGGEVWACACSTPEGGWLSCRPDQPLANGRLLFWGCAANRISGFLCRGYNPPASAPNSMKGDDALVYPGEGGPWPSLRLEAARQGAHEAALLAALRARDAKAHDALIARVFTGFSEYDNDPDRLDALHEELLRLLTQAE